MQTTNSLLSQARLDCRGVHHLWWCLLVMVPVSGLAAGVAYLPGAKTDAVLGGQRSVAVLTWQLPGGLLIADRGAPGREHRFGEPFVPINTESEWFLVVDRDARRRSQDLDATLLYHGHVHFRGGGYCLVEVPLSQLDAFLAKPMSRQRVSLTPPPPGAERFVTGPAVMPQSYVPKGNRKDLVGDFVAEIDAQAFYQLIKEISGHSSFWFDDELQVVPSRYFNTPYKDVAAAYMKWLLESWGYQAEFDEFSYHSTDLQNVVATKVGITYPEEYVVVGGHYDSYSRPPGAGWLAPGAEDNGSGTSLVMELARLSAGRTFERSVQFVLFDAEEVGLLGSQHFVEEAIAAGRNIVAAITADMVTWYDANFSVIIEGVPEYEWLMSIMEENVTNHTGLGKRKDYYSWGSDHVPFQQAGIPAFLAIDMNWNTYPCYHDTSDTWSHIAATAHIGVEIAKACAATLADVAVLQPEATGVGDGRALTIKMLAYPNPFNPMTVIRYDLPMPSRVTLRIHDLSGRLVRSLRNATAEKAGRHEVMWHGRDDSGRSVASGTYFYRLTAGPYTETRRMVLLK